MGLRMVNNNEYGVLFTARDLVFGGGMYAFALPD